jgi:hypothetical protein
MIDVDIAVSGIIGGISLGVFVYNIRSIQRTAITMMDMAPTPMVRMSIIVILNVILLAAAYVIAPAILTTVLDVSTILSVYLTSKVHTSFAAMATRNVLLATIAATISITILNGVLFPPPPVHATAVPSAPPNGPVD